MIILLLVELMLVSDYVQEDYRPDLYNGESGHLTWVDNIALEQTGSNPAPHYGLAEISICD